MGFRTVVVNQYSKLSLSQNSLIYKTPNDVKKIFIGDINTLICETTDINITTALIAELIKNKIKIIFSDEKHLPIGEIVPYFGSHDTSRKVLLQKDWSENLKDEISRRILQNKIINQAQILGKHNLPHVANLLKLAKNLTAGDKTNNEAQAAKIYFSDLFGDKFLRGNSDIINASLDYGYSLILATISREITKNGYITQIGIHHHNYFNPLNLASDLMEIFRPIIDDIVFHEIIQKNEENFDKIKLKLLMIFGYFYNFNGEKIYFDNLAEKYVHQVFAAIEEKNPAKIPTWEIENK